MLSDAEKAAARVGTIVANKYQLKRVLGVGGMGAVYEAVHAFTGKHCAIKVIDKSVAGIEGYAARFLREARAAADIQHPAICDVLDAGEAEDQSLYLVLELLEGEDFGAAIKRRDLRVNEVVQVVIQLLGGLEAAHSKGIIHRDIKPENIFLTRTEKGDLRVKLLDFGVAKNVRRQDRHQTQAGTVIGTPYYMSPEQACGDEVDPRADLWAVGAVLYHALALRPPYEAPSYHMLVLKIIDGPPRALQETRPDLPEWICKVVDRALRHDRKERWPTARAMMEALASRGGAGTMELDWEQHEDSTTRTASPFEEAIDSLPPPAAGLLTPRSQSGRQVHISPPVDENLARTMEASPTARAEMTGPNAAVGPETPVLPPNAPTPKPHPTPQAWETPAPPPVISGAGMSVPPPRRSPLLIAALIAGALLVAGGAILLGILVAMSFEPDPQPVPLVPPQVPMMIPDAGGLMPVAPTTPIPSTPIAPPG